MNKQKTIVLLSIILIGAGVLRIFHLSAHDVITDEVFYGYRSISLIDSVHSQDQPTPFETFNDNIPAWAHLSFHDHPPLGFWIQHIFFKLFGVNLWAMRLPFALAGIASVWLVFLIARLLFKDDILSLLAAAGMAVNQNHIWISRIGLQESLVIMFILLAVWLFLRLFQEDQQSFNRKVIGVSIVVGLAVLMKYTAIILVPIFVTWLVWKHKEAMTLKTAALAGIILLAFMAPVIIYNIMLYRATGHFDFQISYLLGQNTPEWQIRLGRDVGGFAKRFKNLFVHFWEYYGSVFSGLTIAAAAILIIKKAKKDSLRFLLASLMWLVILLLIIGPQERFITMLAPFLVLFIIGAFAEIKFKKYVYPIMGVCMLLELLFAINTNLIYQPVGTKKIFYSLAHEESNYWGYNELEQYLVKTFSNTYPEVSFRLQYDFDEHIRAHSVAQAQQSGMQPSRTLIITDSRMYGLAAPWYITRHGVYDGWPIFNEFQYLDILENQPDYFKNAGITDFMFIKAQDTIKRDDIDGIQAESLAASLERVGIKPVEIKGKQNRINFLVYTYQ